MQIQSSIAIGKVIKNPEFLQKDFHHPIKVIIKVTLLIIRIVIIIIVVVIVFLSKLGRRCRGQIQVSKDLSVVKPYDNMLQP